MKVRTIDGDDLAVIGCRRQCGHNLEDPDSIRIASAVEGESPGYSQRRLGARGLINTSGEGLPSYVCRKDSPSCCARGGVIRRKQVSLGRHSNRIVRVKHARY